MEIHQIEDEVPIPPLTTKTGALQQVIDLLEVGQSVFIGTESKVRANSIRGLAGKCALRAHVVITTRIREENGILGIRLWRTE